MVSSVKERNPIATTRVSYETSFDSKQPKLEPKLVSILSETRRLFRLFRINIETACFGVSIEPKQRKRKRNKNKEKGTKIPVNPLFYAILPIILIMSCSLKVL
jgi:hypothetical protein